MRDKSKGKKKNVVFQEVKTELVIQKVFVFSIFLSASECVNVVHIYFKTNLWTPFFFDQILYLNIMMMREVSPPR